MSAPLRLGQVTLANRIVSAPMERNYCTTEGVVTEAYVAYLRARAAGGAALVFSEACYVRADGKGRVRQMDVDTDRQVPGIAALVRAVHDHGAKLGVELNHGGRTAQRRVSGPRPVAPSAVPCLPAGGDVPRELARDEIHDLWDTGRAAAGRSARAPRAAGRAGRRNRGLVARRAAQCRRGRRRTADDEPLIGTGYRPDWGGVRRPAPVR